MSQFFKLIRWPNLVIIIASMSMILVFVITKSLSIGIFNGGMNFFEFMLLVMSVVFIAIGGYIINDIFDIYADSVNKLDIDSPVGNSISVENANILYWVFTIAGIGCGVLLSYLVNQINFGLIFLFSAGLLWFYSQKYQCQPLVGNLVVAFLSALSFGLVWLFEFYSLSNSAELFVTVQTNFPIVNRIVVIYMGFAFFVSFLREIVKDMEDYKGDNRFGCTTFAVKFGISASKIIAYVSVLLAFAMSIYVQIIFFKYTYYLMLSAFFIINLLFIFVLFQIYRSKGKDDYSKVSFFLKLIMFVGVFSMILFYFE